jgi:hypothetical protein
VTQPGVGDTTSHSTETVVADLSSVVKGLRTNGLGKLCEVSGDWSQNGVRPPHSKVADDSHSIVKEQFPPGGLQTQVFLLPHASSNEANWHPACGPLVPYFR